MHFRREEESWRGASDGQAALRRVGEPCGKCLHAHAHMHAFYNSQNGLSTRERASFSAARDLRDTELACGVFGPAHKNLHALATVATAAMTTVDIGSSDRPATTVSRRTLRERGQRRSFHKYSVRPATPALYPFTESS